MFQNNPSAEQYFAEELLIGQKHTWRKLKTKKTSNSSLAESITKKASKQTYFTIRYLVDDALVPDAYRAYAYFRWVDDTLDQGQLLLDERLAYLDRQREIISLCFQGRRLPGLLPEEELVVDLILNDRSGKNGLKIYIEEMMNVMDFDAKRINQPISREEVSTYTRSLATAVTEALHFFIGQQDASPKDHTRYSAVTGAHITHMLRDTMDDVVAGYYNIPIEILDSHGISPIDVNHPAYIAWVKEQVDLARQSFSTGRNYLSRVKNFRCRLAGFAYIARFEIVLDTIEKDGFLLRPAYPERRSTKSRSKMLSAALTQAIRSIQTGRDFEIPSYKPAAEVAK